MHQVVVTGPWNNQQLLIGRYEFIVHAYRIPQGSQSVHLAMNHQHRNLDG